MANAIYPKYKDAILTGASNAALTGSGTTGLYAVLIDTASYTYSDLHEFYPSLTGIVGTKREVTSVTVGIISPAVVDGADTTFLAVPAGPALEAIVLYRENTGPPGTHRLVCYLDSGVTGLPVTPNGGDITAAWNALGIFKL